MSTGVWRLAVFRCPCCCTNWNTNSANPWRCFTSKVHSQTRVAFSSICKSQPALDSDLSACCEKTSKANSYRWTTAVEASLVIPTTALTPLCLSELVFLPSITNNSNDFILQAPHFERRGDNRWENGLPGGQPRGRGQGRGTYPITPQAVMDNQGRSFGPPFPPAPYTNQVNNAGGFFHGTPQGGLSNTPPRHPPGNHHHHPHTQSPPLISGHPAFNPGSYNMEAFQTFPPDVTQATQEGSWGSMAGVGSIQRPPRALSPQAGSSHLFPIQRRVQNLPCPVPGCPKSLGRTQDKRRHLLTHLPHWLHCPAPGCNWRGDRFDVFVRHWSSNGHPSGIQVPNEDECRIYDPQPLMRAISDSTLDIQAAQREAISMVRRRALELQKPELSDNPWGSKCKRQKNSGSMAPMG